MPQTPSDHIEQRATLLDAWVEKRRQIARLEAESAELLVDRLLLRDADTRESPYHRDTIHRSMIAEYSAAARVSQGSVEYAFSDAAFLDSDHPAARESFRRGAITGAHVREIVRAGTIVREAVREGRADAGALDLYDAAAVVVAENETPARTRALVRQIAAALAGETLVDRHRRASSERNVTMRSVDDGLALISIVLPEHLAAAIMDRLTQLARQVIAARDDVEPVLSPDGLDSGENPIFPEDLDWSAPGLDEWAIFGERDTFTTDPLPEPSPIIVPADTRTMDQVRTDLLTDLLLAADPSEAAGAGIDQVRAHIQVTVAATTLLGADDRPAELDGFRTDRSRHRPRSRRAQRRMVPAVPRSGGDGGRDRHVQSDRGDASVPAGARSALPLPRLPHAGAPLPDRSQPRPCPGRADEPVQPQPLLRGSPRAQASGRR